MIGGKVRSDAAAVAALPADHGIAYRPELDGLRAVAVSFVVLFHAGVDLATGGFVGVDIFFVLSGYLITTILIADDRRGRFSLGRFYGRRVRRIAPALVALLLATIVAIFLLLAPEDALVASASVAATAISLSNLYLFLENGYFALVGPARPLLHTWSLAVEGQFYLAYPVLMWALLRHGTGAVRAGLVIAMLACFAFNLWTLAPMPSFTFYMPFARGWEFLAGALLATFTLPDVVRPIREALALLGVALIAVPVFVYDATTPFPGIAALPPVVGTLLLLVFSQASSVGRLLSLKPVVYIGLLSYGMYLWHWPVLVFARYANLATLTPAQTALAVGASLIAAAISFHVIERPFREPNRLSGRLVGWSLATCLSVLFLAGLSGVATQGFAFRRAPEVAWLAEARRQGDSFQKDPCLVRGSAIGRCTVGRGPVSAALWGDSQAAQYVPLVDAIGQAQGFNVRRFTKAGCAPILAQRILPSSDMRRDCPAYNRAVWHSIDTDPRIRTVIVAANWATFAIGETRVEAKGFESTSDGSHALVESSLAGVASAMRQRGGRLIVINQAPIPEQSQLKCFRAAAFLHRDISLCGTDFPSSDNVRRADAVERAFMRQVRSSGAEVIDVMDLLCTRGRCSTLRRGTMLFLDNAHLSPAGAELLGRRLVGVLPPTDTR